MTDLAQLPTQTINVSSSDDKSDIYQKPKKICVRPNVGVVSAPWITTTPICDTVNIQRIEHPRIKVKLKGIEEKGLYFGLSVTGILTTIGLGMLCGRIDKIKKIFKKP